MKYKKSSLLLNTALVGSIILGILAISIFLSLAIGSSTVSITTGIRETLGLIFNPDSSDPLLASIVWNIRLPRTLISALAGAVLSVGGLVFQILLRNPLAEPYLLGISGGAAIGAILGILAGFARFPGIMSMAFVGSMFVVSLLILFASSRLTFNKNSLLLTGVMINAFCSSIIMLLISITKSSKINNIMFWLMGDYSMLDQEGINILFFISIACFFILFRYSNCMNLLQLGSDVAKSMGLDINRITIILLLSSSFMVSVTVSFCGLVGFVGLVVPHVLRMAIGNDSRILVPACIFCGSTYVIICDIMGRVLLSHGNIPTGVVTALIGSPIFIYILLVRSDS